jgi:Coenzyme PQQ synthesis protein D (PqqD)
MSTEGDHDLMNRDTYPRVSEGLEINTVADGYIVYQPDRDRVHYLNHTGVVLLELCDGKTRAAELPGLLMAAYHLASPPTAEVSACLARLFEEGLVH